LDRFEKLIDLGLTTEEAALITTPVIDLTLEQIELAFLVLDEKFFLVRKENNKFVSSKGIHNIINKDNFDPFQNPCDTNVIITNEQQRQDEMKKHGCFDARDTIPHGKNKPVRWQIMIGETI